MKKNITLTALLSLILITTLSFNAKAQVLRQRSAKLMGGRFIITLVANDSLTAERNIDTVITEIDRIERLISDWKADSQISAVNQNAGIAPVKVDREVFELTQRAIRLSRETDGAFDISFAAMERIWKFDGSMTAMPRPEAVKRSVARVGYKNIELDSANCTIYLKLKGMKIGFGALGEGYAADRCREMMLARGIKAGIVNATGDMSTWGKQPNGNDWTIGITNPLHEDTVFAVLPLKYGAVVTSGSYQKFVVFNGKRYTHIINPKTGYPASGLCSVTIFGPSAERANGFSTSMMVLGEQAALKFISRYPEYRYVIITDKGRVHSSPDLGLKTKKL